MLIFFWEWKGESFESGNVQNAGFFVCELSRGSITGIEDLNLPLELEIGLSLPSFLVYSSSNYWVVQARIIILLPSSILFAMVSIA